MNRKVLLSFVLFFSLILTKSLYAWVGTGQSCSLFELCGGLFIPALYLSGFFFIGSVVLFCVSFFAFQKKARHYARILVFLGICLFLLLVVSNG